MGLIVGISVRNLLGAMHHIAGRAAPRGSPSTFLGSPRLNEKRDHFPPVSIFILILILPLSIFPYASNIFIRGIDGANTEGVAMASIDARTVSIAMACREGVARA